MRRQLPTSQSKQNHQETGAVSISAKDSLNDKLAGLDSGADDYLPKPFHLAERNSRIKSVLRRMKFEWSASIDVGRLRINPEARTGSVDDQPVSLNRKGIRPAGVVCYQQKPGDQEVGPVP